MDYKVKVFKLQDVNENEVVSFLITEKFTLLYTSLPYLRLLQAFLNCDIEIVMVYMNERLVGLLPLAFIDDGQEGSVCNSLPFYGSNGAMVVSSVHDNNAIRLMLLNEFNLLVVKRKCIAYTLISNPLDSEGDLWLRKNLEYNLVDERIGQITHLPISNEGNLEQQLIASFEDPRPRNIRKAQKEGVKISVSNTKEALDFLYYTHYNNITAINGIPKEKRFFDMIPDFFNDQEYKIYIAEINGEKIAALLLFYYNQTVEYFTPAVIEKFRNSQPTALIIYQAMLDSIRGGYKNWNWGGTWLSQGGVYDFKKRWATTDHKYFYYTRIKDKSVYKQSKEILLKKYPYFFVLPFSALKNE